MSDQLPNGSSGRTALDVANAVVIAAGRILSDNFYKTKEVQFKGRGNLVTNVDLLAEKLIITMLQEEYPDWGILAEESGRIDGREDEFTWVVDPLDGTRNYASGVPFFSVALALVRGDELLLGMTYDPMRNELFRAESGRGSFLNDQQIFVSKRRTVEESVLGLDMGYQNELAGMALSMLGQLWPGMQSVRIMGSAALGLSYAAAGRIDLYFHQGMSAWDIAGGILQVREAGGVVTDRHGRPASYTGGEVVGSNSELHRNFMEQTREMDWRRE